VEVDRPDYPALYLAASDYSRDGQNTYKRSVQADLALVVAGAALGALAFLVPKDYAAAFAAVAAIVLLGSIVAKYVNKQRSDDKEWFDGRAVAESVKALTWRYMMRLEAFEYYARHDEVRRKAPAQVRIYEERFLYFQLRMVRWIASPE
jgi:hypothetical protein